MKVLTCEICDSTNLIKEDGVFICQSCSTKYSVEEAKKMIIDGTIEVTGTVKIDTSSELTNLYEVARRAKDSHNNENALRYYDMILVKDPSSWEANFYVVFFRGMSCKISEIQNAAISVSNCIPSTFHLVKNRIVDSEEQTNVVTELYAQILLISEMLYNAAKSHYNKIDIQIRNNYTQQYVNNVSASAGIIYNFGNCLTETFEDTFGTLASDAWKRGIKMHNGYINLLQDKEFNKNIILQYSEKIKVYDSSYQTPTIDISSEGCYIATSIYGSYDCPEVWALRRFRDNTLARNWHGRLFVKTYYRISPILVRKFGETKWFKSIGRKQLDKFVVKLFESGVEKTQYQDRKVQY
ncbi:CFI-box-CTERM domain-containing protein [Arcicella sp. LKC2W]|uniref:CFI-box-CTERM domain-containing protein n=1 Tax=Arcicella sp. LKC2W TaxID=2984198 RepID=UPI002B1FDBC2|nr:CFI-box-CTERM domain-containing protein [Arcicella sp. LKC2W]MEA5459931.1 CFI-box-CTERM domain-containing protein [Arcicella sp. LKC2W]